MRRTLTTLALGATLALSLSACGDDDSLNSQDREKASKAALEAAGGGKVTETGKSDDADHAYEVEVTFTNGDDLTVELDKQFGVTKIDR